MDGDSGSDDGCSSDSGRSMVTIMVVVVVVGVLVAAVVVAGRTCNEGTFGGTVVVIGGVPGRATD